MFNAKIVLGWLGNVICVLAVAILSHTCIWAQQAAGPSPTMVDGKKTPNAISDLTAYRLVLCAFAEPPNPTIEQVNRQGRKLSSLHFTPSDRAIAMVILTGFYSEYNQLHAQYQNTPGMALMQPYPPVRDALVNRTLIQLQKQLSPGGMQQFSAFVQRAKSHMKILQYGK